MTTRATGSSSTSRWQDERHRREGHRGDGLSRRRGAADPSESWDQPSNLDGWSIRDSVVHTTGSAAKLVSLAGGETSGPTDDLQQLAARLKDALAKKIQTQR